ncbi:MAG: hypothetical protein MMC33_005714 [Icmadophila ericetorum]|nr:hypothetical protein [Icmadophila ericetorum]
MDVVQVSETGSLSVPTLLTYFTGYYLVEQAAQKILPRFNPEFYARLALAGQSRRYFAFVMGILITLVSTPLCLQAWSDSSNANDIPNHPQASSFASQTCIALRSVLWVSELNRLDFSSAYVVHHLSSLGYLVYHLQARVPLRALYAIYASLITELVSDLACIMTLHGLKPGTSPWTYRVKATNAVLLILLRLPPVVYAISTVKQYSYSDPIFWTCATSLLIYTLFLVRCFTTQASQLKMFQLDLVKPAYITLVQRYRTPLYSIFFSTASLLTAFSTVLIYAFTSDHRLASKEYSDVYLQIGFTGFMALLGARLPSVLYEGGLEAVLSRKLFARSGYWLQSAMLFAIVSIVLFPILPNNKDRTRLLSSLALVSPLGEALGRVGCHFAGCCGCIKSTKGSVIPVQSLTATLNSSAVIVLLFLLYTQCLTLSTAASFSIFFQAAVRLLLSPLRNDCTASKLDRSPKTTLTNYTQKFINTAAALQLVSAIVTIIFLNINMSIGERNEKIKGLSLGKAPADTETFMLASENVYGIFQNPMLVVLAAATLVPSGFISACGS